MMDANAGTGRIEDHSTPDKAMVHTDVAFQDTLCWKLQHAVGILSSTHFSARQRGGITRSPRPNSDEENYPLDYCNQPQKDRTRPQSFDRGCSPPWRYGTESTGEMREKYRKHCRPSIDLQQQYNEQLSDLNPREKTRQCHRHMCNNNIWHRPSSW